MCGLQIRPRTDVDPQRVELPMDLAAYRLAAVGAIPCLVLRYCVMYATESAITLSTFHLAWCHSPGVTHLVWPRQPENPPGGLGLGGSVHEEAHPCFPCFIQPSYKGIDAGSIYHHLVQPIPSINHSV